MNELSIGDILSVLGFIIGVIGIILSINSKSIKKILYEKNEFNLVNENEVGKVKNIEVFHNKKKVDNLTISKIAIWNYGNQTIRQNDISETNKLKVTLDNKFSFLEQKVISTTDNDLIVSLDNNNNILSIIFNYLEPNSGFIIQIIHTGKNSDCLNLSGKIIGGSKLKRVSDISRNAKNKDHWTIKYFVLFFSIAILIVANSDITSQDYIDVLKNVPSIKHLFKFFAGFMIGVVLIKLFERKVPKSLLNNFSNTNN